MHKKPFPRFIILTIIIYTIVNLVFLLVSNIIYVNGRWIYLHSVKAMTSLYTVSDSVDSVNTQVEQLIAGEYENEREIAVSDIRNTLHTVDAAVDEYRSTEKVNEYEEANIKLLTDAVSKYRNEIENIIDVSERSAEEIAEVTAEMCKIHNDTKHILNSIMFMSKKYADERAASSRQFHIISDFLFLIMLLVGVALLILIGINVRRREERLAAKQEEAAFQQSRANKANQKTKDIAYTNLIMDCGNRYALQELMDTMLQNGQNFYLARFVLSDRDALLSMLSYANMDNYMGAMSRRIKEAFGDRGTVYTISGEDFAFLFNNNVTEQQASQYTEDIRRMVGNVGSVTNINVSSNVIGVFTSSVTFKEKGSDAMLSKLHSDYLNAKKAAAANASA